MSDNITSRTITDLNGRTVTIPTNITRAFTIPTGSFCPSYVYVLAPDKLVAWSNSPSDASSLKYFPEPYRDLPSISTTNYEVIIAAHPDVVFMESSNPAAIETAQEKLGSIPVVSILSWTDIHIEDSEKNIRFMGDLLNTPDQADAASTYLTTVLGEIRSNISTIPESKRVRVLYTTDNAGLQSRGMTHTEWIPVCGGIDVVGDTPWGTGSVSLTKETVLKLKPDVILTISPEFIERAYNDTFWEQIPAVQNHRIYLIPEKPVNWFDRPHGVNSIAGLPWTAHVFYPDLFSENWSRSREKEFFSIFYHMDVSDEELSSFLNECDVSCRTNSTHVDGEQS